MLLDCDQVKLEFKVTFKFEPELPNGYLDCNVLNVDLSAYTLTQEYFHTISTKYVN